MTKQSLHISHDGPTESHDHTELTHTIRKEKIKQKARKIYIECEFLHDGADGRLEKEVPLCNTQWYTVVTASIRFLGGSRFLTSSQHTHNTSSLMSFICDRVQARCRELGHS